MSEDAGATASARSPRYKLHQHIGHGSFSNVLVGTANDGRKVAIKQVKQRGVGDGVCYASLRELAMLKRLRHYERHPNVLQLIDVYLDFAEDSDGSYCLHMVFELLEFDLRQYMQRNRLGAEQVRSLSRQLLSGLQFLHSKRIVHRDLKPANLLLDASASLLKVADFGLARVLSWETTLTVPVVTLLYRSPEVLLCCPYGSPVDIWSVGCILYEMTTSKLMFPADTEREMLKAIFETIGMPSAEEWPADSPVSWRGINSLIRPGTPLMHERLQVLPPELASLLRQLLQLQPLRRPLAKAALQHEYFSDARRPLAVVNQQLAPGQPSSAKKRKAQEAERSFGENSLARALRHTLSEDTTSTPSVLGSSLSPYRGLSSSEASESLLSSSGSSGAAAGSRAPGARLQELDFDEYIASIADRSSTSASCDEVKASSSSSSSSSSSASCVEVKGNSSGGDSEAGGQRRDRETQAAVCSIQRRSL